jgi:hypothetical protein
MAEQFAVDDIFNNKADDCVDKEENTTGYEINTEGKEDDQREGKKSVGNHIIFSSIFAVARSFIFWKWPFGGTGTVESVSKLSSEKEQKPHI